MVARRERASPGRRAGGRGRCSVGRPARAGGALGAHVLEGGEHRGLRRLPARVCRGTDGQQRGTTRREDFRVRTHAEDVLGGGPRRIKVPGPQDPAGPPTPLGIASAGLDGGPRPSGHAAPGVGRAGLGASEAADGRANVPSPGIAGPIDLGCVIYAGNTEAAWVFYTHMDAPGNAPERRGDREESRLRGTRTGRPQRRNARSPTRDRAWKCRKRSDASLSERT